MKFNKAGEYTIKYKAWFMPIPKECMVDSFCDKFYWKRTA